jgi:hypothetical protein
MAGPTQRDLLLAAAAGVGGATAGCGGLVPDDSSPAGTPTLVRSRVPSALPVGTCAGATSTGDLPRADTLALEAVAVETLPPCAWVAAHPASHFQFTVRNRHVDREQPPAMATRAHVVVGGRAHEPTFRFPGIVGDGRKVTIDDGEESLGELVDGGLVVVPEVVEDSPPPPVRHRVEQAVRADRSRPGGFVFHRICHVN